MWVDGGLTCILPSFEGFKQALAEKVKIDSALRSRSGLKGIGASDPDERAWTILHSVRTQLKDINDKSQAGAFDINHVLPTSLESSGKFNLSGSGTVPIVKIRVELPPSLRVEFKAETVSQLTRVRSDTQWTDVKTADTDTSQSTDPVKTAAIKSPPASLSKIVVGNTHPSAITLDRIGYETLLRSVFTAPVVSSNINWCSGSNVIGHLAEQRTRHDYGQNPDMMFCAGDAEGNNIIVTGQLRSGWGWPSEGIEAGQVPNDQDDDTVVDGPDGDE
jgi:hypothetical protein